MTDRDSLEAHRPGDAFPNVGYVRGFIGGEVYRRWETTPDGNVIPLFPEIPFPIVGMIGKKRSGKDTFAEGLVRRGATRVAFADPLKEAALALDPIIGRPAYPNVLAPQSDVRLSTYVGSLGWERAKEFPEVRRLLQNYGVAIREIDPDFWTRAGMEKAAEIDGPVVITDVRFPNEAEAVVNAGGVIVRVVRPGIVSDDTHVSETALDDYPQDYLVENTGTAEDLIDLARTMRF